MSDNRALTLGSLFDGSGGFPLGGILAGVQPVWASEVEPFAIRVTTKRLPFDRTAGELIASLHRYPDDLGATVGDWKPEAGAWIRFNALDGEGVRNENVISFKYALVESDAMPVDEQIAMYRREELPIAALVSSAGKSVHAIVHVDAADAQEYRKRVTFLYDFLAARGLKVDTQNRNPSRLSRMPGVTRNGQIQKLLGVNIGRRSWVDWMDFVEGATDELPGLASLADFAADPPPLPEELIQGVLRWGHKMLISGSSKAGKSFLLMELSIAIAEGMPWLGFPCRKGRVLYVNLEIDPASCVNRFIKIYDAMGYDRKYIDDIIIWNLRGHQMENMNGTGVSVKDMAAHLGLAERTIRERVNKMNGEFILEGGMILTPDLTQ